MQHSDPPVKWVDISPELAEEWLGKNHGNRNQRDHKIIAYTRDIKDGNWLQTGETIKFDTDGRLIDGQHRLEAIHRSGETLRMLVVMGLSPHVQSVLDVNIRRSAADALKFNGITHNVSIIPAMARIDRVWSAGLLRSATSSMGGDVGTVTNSEVVAWEADNKDAHDSASMAQSMYKDLGATPSALAYAMWRTNRVDPDAAHEFWSSVAEMRTRGVGDPRFTMIKTFKKIDELGKQKTTALQLSIIFRAWNAWREGRSLTKLPMEAGGKSVTLSDPK